MSLGLQTASPVTREGSGIDAPSCKDRHHGSKGKVHRLLNLALRLSTLGTRLVFVLVLARFLDPAQVGYYGLFTSAVGYALYVVGMDYYTFSTREVLRVPPEQRGAVLKGQAALSGGLYVLALPLALVLLAQTNWQGTLLWWFAPILILEHINQELSRLLVALSRQLSASWVLFLRQGSWAIVSVILLAISPESRSLDLIFALWALAGLAAAVLGGLTLWSLEISGWRAPIDWGMIRRGVAVSLGFLVSTLALRGVQTLDRYWLEALGGLEVVAAYVLFTGVAGALMVFLDAGVFAFAYPDLIRFGLAGKRQEARRLLRRTLAQTLVISAAFAALSWALLPYLLGWIGNPVYAAQIGLFPWVLTATILNALGLIPHYGLYARNVDKPIILSHLAGLVAFIAATWAFSRLCGAPAIPFAVPFGVNVAFLIILIVKATAYFYLLARRDETAAPRPSG